MKANNPFNDKDASKIIIETSLNLIEQLNIKNSKLSSYLIGYIDLKTEQAVSQWLIDNWYFETTVDPHKYLYEITEELERVLNEKSKLIHMPWLMG